ncbi:LOW QUALITY PROTEIN: ciliary microtubule inner protein 6 [Sylvia borin]
MLLHKASKGLLELLQEQTSFSHWYNARESGNEPIRGKIKPMSAIAPKGTEILPSARGSCSPERPKTEKGNSMKSMTSPTFFLQNSETLGSENLSKPDVREIAKAYPRIPAGGHKSSGISQLRCGRIRPERLIHRSSCGMRRGSIVPTTFPRASSPRVPRLCR